MAGCASNSIEGKESNAKQWSNDDSLKWTNFYSWIQDVKASGLENNMRRNKVLVFWKRIVQEHKFESIDEACRFNLPRNISSEGRIAWSTKVTYFGYCQILIRYVNALNIRIPIWINKLQKTSKIAKQRCDPIPILNDKEYTRLKITGSMIGKLYKIESFEILNRTMTLLNDQHELSKFKPHYDIVRGALLSTLYAHSPYHGASFIRITVGDLLNPKENIKNLSSEIKWIEMKDHDQKTFHSYNKEILFMKTELHQLLISWCKLTHKINDANLLVFSKHNCVDCGNSTTYNRIIKKYSAILLGVKINEMNDIRRALEISFGLDDKKGTILERLAYYRSVASNMQASDSGIIDEKEILKMARIKEPIKKKEKIDYQNSSQDSDDDFE